MFIYLKKSPLHTYRNKSKNENEKMLKKPLEFIKSN